MEYRNKFPPRLKGHTKPILATGSCAQPTPEFAAQHWHA